MTEKMNVESFNLDHTKVKAPFVRLAGTKVGLHGDEIYKYDVRLNSLIKNIWICQHFIHWSI